MSNIIVVFCEFASLLYIFFVSIYFFHFYIGPARKFRICLAATHLRSSGFRPVAALTTEHPPNAAFPSVEQTGNGLTAVIVERAEFGSLLNIWGAPIGGRSLSRLYICCWIDNHDFVSFAPNEVVVLSRKVVSLSNTHTHTVRHALPFCATSMALINCCLCVRFQLTTTNILLTIRCYTLFLCFLVWVCI